MRRRRAASARARIVGSGTVSNNDRAAARPASPSGACSRPLEHGKPLTPFLYFGDRVRIEMLDAGGRSIFGAIDQRVVKAP